MVAARGDNALGGKNFDAAIRRWVDTTLGNDHPDLLSHLRSGSAPHAVLAVDESVRRAKELLSGSASATIAVPDPRTDTVVTLTLTRDEFEAAIRSDVERAAALTAACLADAGSPAVTAIYLTGGSSRIPLVHQAIGTLGAVATLDDPKTVVARGALIAAAGDSIGPDADRSRPPTDPGRSRPFTEAAQSTPARRSTDTGDRRARSRLLIAAVVAAAVVATASVLVIRQIGSSNDTAVAEPSASATESSAQIQGSFPDDVDSVEAAVTIYLAVLGSRDEQVIGPMRCSTSEETVDDLPPRAGPPGDLTITPRAFDRTTIDGDTATSAVRISVAVDAVLSPADGDGTLLGVDLAREMGGWKICGTRQL